MKKTIEILNEYWAGKTVQLNTETRKSSGEVSDCLYSDEQLVGITLPLPVVYEPITVTVDHVEEKPDGYDDGGIDYILKFKEAPNLYHYLD